MGEVSFPSFLLFFWLQLHPLSAPVTGAPKDHAAASTNVGLAPCLFFHFQCRRLSLDFSFPGCESPSFSSRGHSPIVVVKRTSYMHMTPTKSESPSLVLSFFLFTSASAKMRKSPLNGSRYEKQPPKLKGKGEMYAARRGHPHFFALSSLPLSPTASHAPLKNHAS